MHGAFPMSTIGLLWYIVPSKALNLFLDRLCLVSVSSLKEASVLTYPSGTFVRLAGIMRRKPRKFIQWCYGLVRQL